VRDECSLRAQSWPCNLAAAASHRPDALALRGGFG